MTEWQRECLAQLEQAINNPARGRFYVVTIPRSVWLCLFDYCRPAGIVIANTGKSQVSIYPDSANAWLHQIYGYTAARVAHALTS